MTLRVLYIGDIMGQPGIQTVAKILPDLKSNRKIDAVIAQGENVTDGRGISLKDYQYLRNVGIDFFTGGNWTTYNSEIHEAIEDDDQPIIRPANYPEGTVGNGYKYLKLSQGDLLVISLLGQIVGRDSSTPTDNPLKVIDNILVKENGHPKIGIVVDFHGDYSSEKVVIGHYLDGRVSAVVGDHWHVPTADARVLPKGTAHITDVGMTGTLNSSLGVSLEVIINRWKEDIKAKNSIELNGPKQFNSVLIEIDSQSGLAKSIERIYLETD